jgi:hypothetical protein
VLLRQSRFLPTVFLVCVTAFLLGLGNVVTGSSVPSRTHPTDRPSDAARSGDDLGFSITLSSPREPYLLGRQTIVIDPTIPAGDKIAQVDIFVDGRLVFTDRQPPYTFDSDFGETITRHVIVATAVTRGGRRAKVSFVSRSGDLSDPAARAIEMVPVVVRDAHGRAVSDLSVSDFTLLENGARQRIVHFDNRPTPASVAVMVQGGEADGAARKALLAGAAAFAEALPPYQAVALLGAVQAGSPASGSSPAAARNAPATGGSPEPEFSYGRDPFRKRLDQAIAAVAPAPARPLGEVLAAAAVTLRARADQRVLLLLLAGAPLRTDQAPEETAPAAEGRAADGSPAGGKVAEGKLAGGKPAAAQKAAEAETSSRDPSLAAGLEALRRSKVTVYVLILGAAGDEEPYADLRRAADESGGDVTVVDAPAEVERGCRRLSESFLHEYLIGYLPEAPEKSGWRALELKVSRAEVQVRARKGYSID